MLRGFCQAGELQACQQANDDTCFADAYFYSIMGLLRQFLGWHWLSGLSFIMNFLVNFMLMYRGMKLMYDQIQSGYTKPGSIMSLSSMYRVWPLNLLFTGSMFSELWLQHPFGTVTLCPSAVYIEIKLTSRTKCRRTHGKTWDLNNLPWWSAESKI